MYSILGRGSFCFNYCLNLAWHGVRAGLVIWHTGHFPGGPTHYRAYTCPSWIYIYSSKCWWAAWTRKMPGPIFCPSPALHGVDQFVVLLRWYGSQWRFYIELLSGRDPLWVPRAPPLSTSHTASVHGTFSASKGANLPIPHTVIW